MFDIGFTELTLLAVIGLLVLGPERLPAVARVVGGYLRKARRTWATVRAEIETELQAEEIRRSVGNPASELERLRAATMERLDLEGKRLEEPDPAADPAPDEPDDEARGRERDGGSS